MGAEPLRVTIAVAQVLRVLITDADKPFYGYALMTTTGFSSGKLYPILKRLFDAGWIEAVQNADGNRPGSPPRRSFALTPSGAVAARQALADIHQTLT
jgi:DNA-binding PadR family transcriptional regulator